jgi:hypothetical protein
VLQSKSVGFGRRFFLIRCKSLHRAGDTSAISRGTTSLDACAAEHAPKAVAQFSKDLVAA